MFARVRQSAMSHSPALPIVQPGTGREQPAAGAQRPVRQKVRPAAAPARAARPWARALPAFIGLALFFVALEVLRIELRSVSWPKLTNDVLGVPRTHLAVAVLLTILNYAVLTGYDLVAFVYISKALPRARVMLTSFLAYAIANNIGLAMLSGASVRYRFYTRWGVTAEELSRIIFSYSVTFWLGLFALGGLSLAVTRLPASGPLPAGEIGTLAGCWRTSSPNRKRWRSGKRLKR
ncbi:MAG: lysylphosphatidylglycerol synthase transmembrane domain-containing protein [Vicinamibacterales bacterium]